LAGAWLAIAITLGAVVAQAVFRGGRVTYHRIVGAILLYLLIAVAFGTLFLEQSGNSAFLRALRKLGIRLN
jgi:uncharacterized membrane protein